MKKILTTMWIGTGVCAIVLALAITFGVHAQSVQVPAPVAAVCAFTTSPVTVSSNTFVYVQCDHSGELLFH